jgi:uncharacterized membrane protein
MARLEALTTGQLLDRIFTFYRKHFVLFFAIALIPQLSRLIPLFATSLFGGGGMGVGGAFSAIVAVLVWLPVFAALIAVSQGAVTVAVSDIYLDKPASLANSYRRVAPMTLRLIGMMLGYGLLIFIGFVFLVVPGIYFLLTYALATAVMAIENVSFSEAMTRSKDLVVGNRGRIFIIFLLSFIIQYAVAFAIGIPFGVVLAKTRLMFSYPFAFRAISTLVEMLASAISTPISLIGFTLAYYDARVRKEAFDLEYMMESAAAEVPAAMPPAPIVAGAAAGATASSGSAGDTVAASTGGSTFMLFDHESSSPATPPAPTESNSGPTEG